MADETMINSLNKDRHSNESFELGPITVVTREPLAPNVELLICAGFRAVDYYADRDTFSYTVTWGIASVCEEPRDSLGYCACARMTGLQRG
jgi:hypothetical protein